MATNDKTLPKKTSQAGDWLARYTGAYAGYSCQVLVNRKVTKMCTIIDILSLLAQDCMVLH